MNPEAEIRAVLDGMGDPRLRGGWAQRMTAVAALRDVLDLKLQSVLREPGVEPFDDGYRAALDDVARAIADRIGVSGAQR